MKKVTLKLKEWSAQSGYHEQVKFGETWVFARDVLDHINSKDVFLYLTKHLENPEQNYKKFALLFRLNWWKVKSAEIIRKFWWFPLFFKLSMCEGLRIHVYSCYNVCSPLSKAINFYLLFMLLWHLFLFYPFLFQSNKSCQHISI